MKKLNDILFIWIPKTAGTSIYTIFEKNGCLKLKSKEKFENFINKGFVTFGHVSVNHLLKVEIIKTEFFNNSFKFCFVRNPYDRTVSLFHHFKRKKNRLPDNIITFNDFCNYIYNEKVSPIGLYNYKKLSQCNPQYLWIPKKIDFIGRFENLQNDFNYICDKIGIEKTELPWKNKSKRDDYKSYYDKETKELIYNFYKEDFKKFGYDKRI